MDTIAIIGLLASALVGAIATYSVAVLRIRGELRNKYDMDLRGRRIGVYLELWKLLEDLPKYARPKQLTRGDLGSLSVSLRQWYFQKGGLFLSKKGRDTYFRLQDAITEELESRTPSDEPLDEVTYQALRRLGHDLREALALDVGTRKDLKGQAATRRRRDGAKAPAQTAHG